MPTPDPLGRDPQRPVIVGSGRPPRQSMLNVDRMTSVKASVSGWIALRLLMTMSSWTMPPWRYRRRQGRRRSVAVEHGPD